jgi:hypothetical protein
MNEPTSGSEEQKPSAGVSGGMEEDLALGTGLGEEQKPSAGVLGCTEEDLPLGTGQWSSPLTWDSSSVKGDPEQGLEETEDNMDITTLSSHETNFESSQCVHNYSIKLSQDILEKSARAYSMLQVPCFADKGTVRRMAQAMLE